VKFPAFRRDPCTKLFERQRPFVSHPVFGEVPRPLLCVKCFSRAVSNSEASSVDVEGDRVFALGGIVIELRQQQLLELKVPRGGLFRRTQDVSV